MQKFSRYPRAQFFFVEKTTHLIERKNSNYEFQSTQMSMNVPVKDAHDILEEAPTQKHQTS